MQAFNEKSLTDFETSIKAHIVNEIQSKTKEYILQVNEKQFKAFLLDKYQLEPLAIDEHSESFKEPLKNKEHKTDRFHGGTHVVEVYTFTINYHFKGSPQLFHIQPNPWNMRSYEISVNQTSNTVSFSFKLYNQSAEEFEKIKRSCFHDAFCNIDNINKNVAVLNASLEPIFTAAFKQQKEKYIKEDSFFAAINLKIKPNTESVSVPTVKKKIIPQPIVTKEKAYVPDYFMDDKTYQDIIRVIYDVGKNMETKPSLYINKDEEGLRDQFLLFLENRYEATTATGETFNHGGKTDILLKYAGGPKNLFVAECKFWHGVSEFHAAISQLFDRYLSWRDSKAALILFVRNKEFTRVLNSIKESAIKHPYYIRPNGNHQESSFSYLFCLPQDKEKMVYFEIIVFHFDK